MREGRPRPGPSNLGLVLRPRYCSSVCRLSGEQRYRSLFNITTDSVGQAILDSSSSSSLPVAFCVVYWRQLFQQRSIEWFNKVYLKSSSTASACALLPSCGGKQAAWFPYHSCSRASFHHPPLLQPRSYSRLCSRQQPYNTLPQIPGFFPDHVPTTVGYHSS